MSDEVVQPPLPLLQGSWDYWSISCHYVRHQGWNVRMWHGHDGQRGVCPSSDTYEALTNGELGDVLDAVAAQAAGPHILEDGRCSPRKGS
jgi:hypothetical protein